MFNLSILTYSTCIHVCYQRKPEDDEIDEAESKKTKKEDGSGDAPVHQNGIKPSPEKVSTISRKLPFPLKKVPVTIQESLILIAVKG